MEDSKWVLWLFALFMVWAIADSKYKQGLQDGMVEQMSPGERAAYVESEKQKAEDLETANEGETGNYPY